VRLVVMTHNIWALNRWPQREPALRALLGTRRPDIYAVQELRPTTRAVIDAELPGHRRVEDDERGWSHESSIWWNTELLTEVEHGTRDIGIGVDEIHRDRRLFWVRLADSDGTTFVISTAHFCFPGTQQELERHVNPRIAQSEAAAAALDDLAGPDEPIFFMGDLNESWHVLRVLSAAGLTDSFSALGVVPPPTWHRSHMAASDRPVGHRLPVPPRTGTPPHHGGHRLLRERHSTLRPQASGHDVRIRHPMSSCRCGGVADRGKSLHAAQSVRENKYDAGEGSSFPDLTEVMPARMSRVS